MRNGKFKKLNDFCEVKDGTHDSPKYVDEKDGVPFVTQKNILDNGLSFERNRFISQEDHNHFYKDQMLLTMIFYFL